MNEVNELFVFRIIQELTNNIVKHSQASTVKISLKAENNLLEVHMEDDGVGFQQHDAKNAKGIGLKSVASRVNYLNGKIETESSTDGGTTIRIEIPLDGQTDAG